MISYKKVLDAAEIDVLLGKASTFANLHYKYDQETVDMLKKYFTRPDSFYSIVRDGEQFVAFCSTDSDWWEPQYFFLREIFVMPEYQGQQIGEKLMRDSIQHAKEQGAEGIVTETAFENVPMQKLCERCSFKQWENPQWKDGVTFKLMFREQK